MDSPVPPFIGVGAGGTADREPDNHVAGCCRLRRWTRLHFAQAFTGGRQEEGHTGSRRTTKTDEKYFFQLAIVHRDPVNRTVVIPDRCRPNESTWRKA